jgi:hypothetical protein
MMTTEFYKDQIEHLSTRSRFCLTSRRRLVQIKKELQTLK